MRINKRVLSLFLVVSALFFPGAAHASADRPADFVRTLDEAAVAAFIERFRNISMGVSEEISQEEIEAYLKKHLSEKVSLRSKTTYEMPGYPVQDVEMTYGKDDFISNIKAGAGLLENYETSVVIEDFLPSGSGRAATFRAKITETGRMPWPDGKGGQEMVPIRGESECLEKVIISLSNYVQLADAACTTTISLTPFSKPLGE